MTTVAAPTLSGLHHLKIPVLDLEVSLDWYQRVFDAVHLRALDHIDSDGARYAAILNIAGVPVPLELRWAPSAARALRECDIIVLAVDSAGQLDDWVQHLDASDVEHSPILTGAGGAIVVIADPDGKFIRLMVSPPGGVTAQTLPPTHLDPQGPWLDPAPMRHPRPQSTQPPTPTRTPG
jgi:catechol 2,3-dioxygenase-like lactoylglutathione lyase family enzyme